MECRVLPPVVAEVLEYGEGTVHGEVGGWQGHYSCVLPFYLTWDPGATPLHRNVAGGPRIPQMIPL